MALPSLNTRPIQQSTNIPLYQTTAYNCFFPYVYTPFCTHITRLANHTNTQLPFTATPPDQGIAPLSSSHTHIGRPTYLPTTTLSPLSYGISSLLLYPDCPTTTPPSSICKLLSLRHLIHITPPFLIYYHNIHTHTPNTISLLIDCHVYPHNIPCYSNATSTQPHSIFTTKTYSKLRENS